VNAQGIQKRHFRRVEQLLIVVVFAQVRESDISSHYGWIDTWSDEAERKITKLESNDYSKKFILS